MRRKKKENTQVTAFTALPTHEAGVYSHWDLIRVRKPLNHSVSLPVTRASLEADADIHSAGFALVSPHSMAHIRGDRHQWNTWDTWQTKER